MHRSHKAWNTEAMVGTDPASYHVPYGRHYRDYRRGLDLRSKVTSERKTKIRHTDGSRETIHRVITLTSFDPFTHVADEMAL